MPTINRLSQVDTITAGDIFPVYSQSNGDSRAVAMATVANYVLSLTSADSKITQYNTPTATGFSVQVTNGSASVWLILTPLATYATGTIVLPTSTLCVNHQEILCVSTQIVTALTVSGNGASVVGAPTALTAGGFFTLKYDSVLTTWFRIN